MNKNNYAHFCLCDVFIINERKNTLTLPPENKKQYYKL